MNLTWHIIKKDLRCLAWPIALWASTGLYWALGAPLRLQQADNLYVIVTLTHLMIMVSLVAKVVQEDDVTGTTVFWRTRPISPGQLLASKLGLLLVLFAIIEVVFLGLRSGNPPFPLATNGKQYAYALIGLSSLVLSLAAIASCCQELGRYLAIAVACVLASFALTSWLCVFGDALPRPFYELMKSKLMVIALLCGVAGLAILANQYLRRRLSVTVAIIAIAVAGSAVIGAFWPWKFA